MIHKRSILLLHCRYICESSQNATHIRVYNHLILTCCHGSAFVECSKKTQFSPMSANDETSMKHFEIMLVTITILEGNLVYVTHITPYESVIYSKRFHMY